MIEQQSALQNLRNYSSREDWSLCVESIKQLVPHIVQGHLVKIILKRAIKYLSVTLQSHQRNGNLIQAIGKLENIQSFDELGSKAALAFEFIKNEWSDPGIGNCKHALADLSTIPYLTYGSHRYFDVIVTVILNILKSLSSADYCCHNPELWRAWSQPVSKDNTFILDPVHALDPANTEFTKSLWVELADDIDAALQTQS
jgi:hypothetical protein